MVVIPLRQVAGGWRNPLPPSVVGRNIVYWPFGPVLLTVVVGKGPCAP